MTPHAWLSEDAGDLMLRAATAACPNETGGILVGVRVRRRPWITHAVAIPSKNGGAGHYTLEGHARQSAVDTIRAVDHRVGYVGEWHSHPADVPPSRQDLRAIARLSHDPGAECPHPVLILVRRNGGNWVIDAREWRMSCAKRLRLIAAGGLPRPEAETRL